MTKQFVKNVIQNVTDVMLLLKIVENVLLSESIHQLVTVHFGLVSMMLSMVLMLYGLVLNVLVNVILVLKQLINVNLVPVSESITLMTSLAIVQLDIITPSL
jgi:hypothetical protein